MIPRLAISALCGVAFGSCEKKSEGPGVSPEVAALLRRVQQENGLDDDRLRKSLDQWVKTHQAASEFLGSGKITPEELKESVASAKETVRMVGEQISQGDLMNVGLLDGLVSGKEAEMKDHLRREVARAYRKAAERKADPVHAGLIEKVEALREKDPALDGMIRAEASGEEGR
jgi:hypothetical protein